MNSGLSGLRVAADRDGPRLAVAIVLATLLCVGLLLRSADWLAIRKDARRAPTTIEMRVVEIAPPVRAPSVSPVVHAEPALPRAAEKRTVQRPQRESTRPAARHGNPAAAQPVHEEARLPAESAPPRREAAASSDAQSAPGSTARSNGATNAAPPGPAGSMRARVLSQPMPVLPDDLREQAYQVTAVAHFTVHADGSFEVELVTPTQNPRLNQILLDTLHRWRFFPAMENGRPVESDQDVRVHFSVN